MIDSIKWGGAMYDGVAFSDVGLTVTKVDIPLLPEVKITEEDIAGYDGSIPLSTQYGPRPIEISVMLIADNEADYQSKLQRIAMLFNVMKRTRPLILSRAPGKRWLCSYNGRIPIEKLAAMGEFTIPLKAYMPFAESVTTSTEPLRLGQGYSLGQGLRLSDGANTFTITSSPTEVNVANLGTYKAHPKLIVKATSNINGLSIENVTTGEKMAVTATLAAGSELVVDCAPLKLTCRIDGESSYGLIEGDFMRLEPGDNKLLITADGSINATLGVEFRYMYLH